MIAVDHIPYQQSSETSREAAERVRPHAGTDEATCLALVEAAGLECITRKEIAAMAFQSQQNRVTGRISSLLAKQLIREVQRLDGPPGEELLVKVKRNGSVLLAPTFLVLRSGLSG